MIKTSIKMLTGNHSYQAIKKENARLSELFNLEVKKVGTWKETFEKTIENVENIQSLLNGEAEKIAKQPVKKETPKTVKKVVKVSEDKELKKYRQKRKSKKKAAKKSKIRNRK